MYQHLFLFMSNLFSSKGLTLLSFLTLSSTQKYFFKVFYSEAYMISALCKIVVETLLD